MATIRLAMTPPHPHPAIKKNTNVLPLLGVIAAIPTGYPSGMGEMMKDKGENEDAKGG